MIENTLFNTKPVIVHSPGTSDQFRKIQLQATHAGKAPRSDVTIITWNSRSSLGVFQKSCAMYNIPLVVLGAGIKLWQHPMKIDLTIHFLEECETKYVMGIDCYDVIVVGDLEAVIEEYKQRDCHILFNATVGRYPFHYPYLAHRAYPYNQHLAHYDHLENVISKKQVPETSIFRYLNAGVWVGETKLCLDFFRLAADQNSIAEEIALRRSEQARVKLAYFTAPEHVALDWSCQVFQTLHLPLFYPAGVRESDFIRITEDP